MTIEELAARSIELAIRVYSKVVREEHKVEAC